MNDETQTDFVYERPQVSDDLYTANTSSDIKHLIVDNIPKPAKGLISGLLIAISFWILIIGFIIWVI